MRLWSAIAISGAFACSPGATPDIPPIALTPTEYNNTVRDLLGMPSDGRAWPDAPPVADRLSPSLGEQAGLFGFAPIETPPWPWVLPEDLREDGFEGMVDGQAPSAYQLEELQKAAVHFGAFTLVSPSFFTCANWDSLGATAQQDCAWDSLERFAQRAWRRPFLDDERARLEDFWLSQVAQGPLDEAVALTAAGVMQAPQFVFRIERGRDTKREKGRIRLTDWEIASRLSYLIWDSLPDEALFAAAANGELSKRKGIEAQVERMLQDPRAQEAVVHFHQQWLETEQVHQIAPARLVFGPLYGISPQVALDTTGDEEWPAILGPIRHSMEAETYLFITQTLFAGAGTLEALLSDHHGFLTEHTAPLYGDGVTPLGGATYPWSYGYVAASNGAQGTLLLEPVTFPRDQRAGLLTLPSVLAIGAHPVHPSPILRGKRVLERVTCTELGTPPPGAEGMLPPDTPDATATNRQRTEEVTSPAGCAGCHDLINPAGFAFESYDSMGGFRETDNGQPVDTSGTIRLGETTLSFESGTALSRKLATHPVVQDCYALRWTRYATGVHLDPTDPEVEQLLADFREDDRVLTLLESIATSDLFRYRALGGAP